MGLFQYLQNWAVGFTDWNLLLDLMGGPFHNRGFGCNAPIQTNGTAGFVVQAPYYFMAHFSKFLPPGATIVGAMAYTGTGAPAPRGAFWYGVDDAGIQENEPTEHPRLAQLGARLPNGTNVLLLMNTAASTVPYTLKAGDGRTARMRIAGHTIQTLRWN